MKSRSLLLLVACLATAACLAPGALRAEQYNDHVVIVLDASGSMEERLQGTQTSKMAAAKSALKTVVQNVPATTHIGLLVFSGQEEQSPWLYPLGPRDDTALAGAIDRPRPGGGTPLGQYIKLGADRLLQEREKQFGYGSYRLLVVTDGEANDRQLVDAYTPEVMARGITVDVIGVGMRTDHTLATKVHSYRRANDPDSLRQAVAEVLAEVSRPRSDSAAEEAFALLDPIPSEVASAALQALSTSGNLPIGEHPDLQQSSAATRAVRSPAAQGQPQPQSGQPSPRWQPFRLTLMFLFGLAVFVTVIRRVLRRH